jgi:hypothetical protein
MEEKLKGTWQFYQDDKQRWRWRCAVSSSNKVVESEQCFENYTDVIVDAAQHGLVLSPKRRPLPSLALPLLAVMYGVSIYGAAIWLGSLFASQ